MNARPEPTGTVPSNKNATGVAQGTTPVNVSAAERVAVQVETMAPFQEPGYRRIIMDAAAIDAQQRMGRTSASVSTDKNAPSSASAERDQRSANSATLQARTHAELAAQVAASPAAASQTNKATARTWGGWFSSVASSIGSAADVIGHAIIGAAKLTQEAGAAVVGVVTAVIKDPMGAVEGIGNAVSAAGRVICTAVPYIGQAIYSGAAWCIQNPGQALGLVGSALYAVGEFAVSLVTGLVSSVCTGVQKLWRGEMSLGEALLNTFVFCCELSGLADLWGAVKHGALAFAAYAKGDRQAALQHLGQCAMHGAFVAIALATVGTGGLAAPVLVPLMAARALAGVALKQGIKQGIKACVRECVEFGAKEIGEAAIKNMGEAAGKKLATELPQEMAKITVMAEKTLGASASPQALAAKVHELALERVIQLQGESIALTMGKTLSGDLATKGTEVLTRQHVTALGEEIGHAQTKALLRELGLVKHVDDLTHDMLVSINGMSHKQARQHFIETMGVSTKQADEMAREVQKLLRSGKSDDAIKQVLEDRISKGVSEFVEGKMESSFKTTFRKGLQGELKDPDNIEWSSKLRQGIEKRADDLAKDPKANPHGKSARELGDDITDDLVDGGWEGVQKGIRRATRELVREGIECAFKRFRSPRTPHVAPHRDQDESDTPNTPLSKEAELDNSKREQERKGEESTSAASRGNSEREVVYREVTRADGTTVRVRSTYENERLMGVEEEVLSGPARKSERAAKDDTFGSAA